MPMLIWLARAGLEEAQKNTLFEMPALVTQTRLLPQPAAPPRVQSAAASPLLSVKSWRNITPASVRVTDFEMAFGSASALVLTGKRRPSLRVTSKFTSLLAKGEPSPW